MLRARKTMEYRLERLDLIGRSPIVALENLCRRAGLDYVRMRNFCNL